MSNKQKLRVSLAEATRAGAKEQNEDFVGHRVPSSDHELQLKGVALAIADGMSGSDGGKQASETSVTQFLDDYYKAPESWSAQYAVSRILNALNTMLLSRGQVEFNSTRGLVTTFSAVIIKSQTVHLFHVGDARIYRLRDGKLLQLSTDHRVMLSDTKDYLSRALGIDSHLEVDYREEIAKQGDIYLCSTDGIHDFVSHEDLEAVASRSELSLQERCDEILTTAETQESTDNLSCQLLRIEELPKVNRKEFYKQLTTLPFPPELSPGNLLDGYRIVQQLQATSRSQVYLAVDTMAKEDDQRVVIKTPSVNYQDDPLYIEQFLHETWVAKRLDSPQLLKPYENGRPRKFLYTELQYVKGQTLQQWMKDNPKPTLPQVRFFVGQLVRGLRAMHRMEMIHQDLKPDNIMIDGNDSVIIVDFASTRVAGLAEIESVLETHHIVGTANYAAPEYFKGTTGTKQSDLYSLGVICYEMLTGHLPYGEISPENAERKKFTYTLAGDYNPGIPDWVDVALEKAVQSTPANRYTLLSEFLADIKQPNEELLAQRKSRPLIEKNPVKFWQSLAAIEFVVILALCIYFMA